MYGDKFLSFHSALTVAKLSKNINSDPGNSQSKTTSENFIVK